MLTLLHLMEARPPLSFNATCKHRICGPAAPQVNLPEQPVATRLPTRRSINPRFVVGCSEAIRASQATVSSADGIRSELKLRAKDVANSYSRGPLKCYTTNSPTLLLHYTRTCLWQVHSLVESSRRLSSTQSQPHLGHKLAPSSSRRLR